MSFLLIFDQFKFVHYPVEGSNAPKVRVVCRGFRGRRKASGRKQDIEQPTIL